MREQRRTHARHKRHPADLDIRVHIQVVPIREGAEFWVNPGGRAEPE